MAEAVTEQFLQSLRSSPSGQQKSGTIFDEIYGALETSENPLDRVIQMISEFHGPWAGGSNELLGFTSMVASMMRSTSLSSVVLLQVKRAGNCFFPTILLSCSLSWQQWASIMDLMVMATS